MQIIYFINLQFSLIFNNKSLFTSSKTNIMLLHFNLIITRIEIKLDANFYKKVDLDKDAETDLLE